MKNILMITILFGGFILSVAQAQTCVEPCPPECCIASCCPTKGSAVSVALMPASNVSNAACTPEQMAACLAICTPEQIAACQAGKKVSKREAKAYQKVCGTPAKTGCMPAVVAPGKSETTIDQTYHQVPRPTKS